MTVDLSVLNLNVLKNGMAFARAIILSRTTMASVLAVAAIAAALELPDPALMP
jgi:hypothetical protein